MEDKLPQLTEHTGTQKRRQTGRFRRSSTRRSAQLKHGSVVQMISYFINQRVGFVYLFVEGPVSLGDYDSTLRDILQDADYEPDLNWICDFLRANLNHHLTLELLKFARFAEQIQRTGDTNMAVVAPVEHVKAISEFVQTHLSHNATKVFGHETHAYQWMVDLTEASEPERQIYAV